MIWRFGYNLMLWALLPLVLLRLYWRGFREPGYRLLLGERFGFYGGEKSRAAGKLVIWVHAVSLGEMNASKPIIDRLIGLLPDARLLITNMTAAGRHEAKKTYGDRAVIVWLPYDYPFAVRRFLSRFKPDLAILMETELWANLIAACRDAKIRMLLANARLSERSARRYHRVFPLISEVISAIDVVAAQSDADRTRFAGLGAKAICVAGNVKFDVPEALGSDEKARAFRKQFGARRVMLWASTREGEEAELLDAFSRRPLTNVLTVIVPRHPQRFSDVARLLDQRGISYSKRSAGNPVSKSDAYFLGDSVGEMAAYFRAADLAFIGGTLLDYGGQNLIEACAAGTPVLLGPSTFNFAWAAEEAISVGAARRVKNASELVDLVTELLEDEQIREAMGAAGRKFCALHTGAADRIAKIAMDLLENGADARG